MVDGNEAIYHKLWPKNVTVKGFAEDFVNTFARNHDTYVIFDRYNEQSIKSHERRRRAKGTVSRKYTLKSDTTLPAKDAVMTSAENKKALINFICNTTHTNSSMHLIGEDGIFGHEEADTNLISYPLKLLPEKRHLQIVAADTDIFVLLVFFWWLKKPSVQVSMKKYDGKVIDINATALKLKDKCFDVLATHALSGCDSVSYPFGKGKVSAINLLLKSDLKLEIFSDPEANETDWLTAGTKFLSALYGGLKAPSLNQLRFTLFSRKKEPPKIRSLPPTDEAAIQHVRRARLQALIWRAADKSEPPKLEICAFGWKLEAGIPSPEFGTTAVAPSSVLQIVACSCKSQPPCSTNRCSCRSARLSCTTYCSCSGDEVCANEHTVSMDSMSATPDEEDDD